METFTVQDPPSSPSETILLPPLKCLYKVNEHTQECPQTGDSRPVMPPSEDVLSTRLLLRQLVMFALQRRTWGRDATGFVTEAHTNSQTLWGVWWTCGWDPPSSQYILHPCRLHARRQHYTSGWYGHHTQQGGAFL